MSEVDIFYDSLEEESPIEDVSLAVPLYTGDIIKSHVTPRIKKKIDKPVKIFIDSNKKKRSYLTMYYEKTKQMKMKEKLNEGSSTTRAIYEKASPKRDLDIENDLKELETFQIGSDSEEEDEFYEKIITSENEKQLEAPKPKVALSKSERAFRLNSYDDILQKAELLKKRQEYGKKMSMKNRIKIEELKALHKIKSTSLLS